MTEPFWTLFHRAWGLAHDAPGYDKAAWVALQHHVERLEEAARPFAEYARRIDAHATSAPLGDACPVLLWLPASCAVGDGPTLGDCRKLAAALAAGEGAR